MLGTPTILEDTNAVMMAGVFYVVYSSFGNPALALKSKLIGVVVRMTLGAAYVTVILPSVQRFDMLALVLAPALIVFGVLLTQPRYSALAFNLVVGLSSPYIISDRFTGDFAGYLNNGLATLTGIVYALVIMMTAQPMWLKTAADRLMRAVYADIACRRYMNPTRWRSRMIHRIAFLVSNSVRSDDRLGQSFDGLREYRTGHVLAELSQYSNRDSSLLAAEVSRILERTSRHYARLARGEHAAPDSSLRQCIDDAVLLTLNSPQPHGSHLTVVLSDLRRNLFPHQCKAHPVPR